MPKMGPYVAMMEPKETAMMETAVGYYQGFLKSQLEHEESVRAKRTLSEKIRVCQTILSSVRRHKKQEFDPGDR